MPEKQPKFNALASRRSKAAVLASSGLLAITMSAESLSFPEPASPGTAAVENILNSSIETRDPFFETTDKQLVGIAKEMDFLIKHDVAHSYADEIFYQGQDVRRLTVAVRNAGENTYTQVVAYLKPGKVSLPISTAIVLEAPRVRFQVQDQSNEPFDGMVAWVPNDTKSNDYAIAHIIRNPLGGWNNRYYEKDGAKNTYWVAGKPKQHISEEKMAAEFDSFANQTMEILSHAGKSMMPPLIK